MGRLVVQRSIVIALIYGLALAPNVGVQADWAGQEDLFGSSIAISGDTLVAGAPYAGENGAAYVFVRTGQSWADVNPAAILVASNGEAGDEFGSAVAIDGDTVLVGAPYADLGDDVNGLAYLFVKPQAGWDGVLTETALLQASASLGGEGFGSAVDISGDTALVGAIFGAVDGNWGYGAAYLFDQPATGWAGALTETAKLYASDGELGDLFGASVAISGDTAAVGAPRRDVGGNWDQGQVYLFRRPGAGWAGVLSETARLVASNGADDEFMAELGNAVAIDGDTVLAAAKSADIGTNLNRGAAYLFLKPLGGWVGTQNEVARLLPSDAQGSDFGVSVALDGETALVGGLGAILGAGRVTGAAYLYVKPAAGWAGELNQTARLVASKGVVDDEFGVAVAIDGGVVGVGARSDNAGGYIDQGSAFVFVQPPTGWSGILIETVQLLPWQRVDLYLPLVVRLE